MFVVIWQTEKKKAINIDVQNLTVADLHASINYHQNTSWAILIASKTLHRVTPLPMFYDTPQ
jgi:hypothetical protein